MSRQTRSILLLGYGNPACSDDGLGPALAALLEKEALDGVTVDADYQLTVEDAADAAQHDVVFFVDAAVSGPEPFSIKRLAPQVEPLGFTSHSVKPEQVLTLARDLFGAAPEGYLVAIRGYRFETFQTGLTEAARQNLQAAAAYLKSMIASGEIREFHPGAKTSDGT